MEQRHGEVGETAEGRVEACYVEGLAGTSAAVVVECHPIGLEVAAIGAVEHPIVDPAELEDLYMVDTGAVDSADIAVEVVVLADGDYRNFDDAVLDIVQRVALDPDGQCCLNILLILPSPFQ